MDLLRSLAGAGMLVAAAAAPASAHVIEKARLAPADGQPGDWFGYSGAVHKEFVVGGAPGHDSVASNAGAAYVYERLGLAAFIERAKLTAFDGAMDDRFGDAVAISFDTIVVTAPFDDDNGADSGSAYVFVRSGSAWNFQAKLTASDGVAGDKFGTAVDLQDDTIVVGAPERAGGGAIYVYERVGTSWVECLTALQGADTDPGDRFGASVALSGDDFNTTVPTFPEMIVGAPNDSDLVTDGGSAYIYVALIGVWTQQTKLTHAAPTAGDQFGTAVDIHGGKAVCGVPYDDALVTDGGAYVVFEDTGTWNQIQHHFGTFALPDRRLGTSVALSDRVVAGGATLDEDLSQTNAGLGYVMFPQQAYFSDTYSVSAPEANAHFGQSVSAHECWLAIGADLADDVNGVDSGILYMHEALHHFSTYCTSGTSASGCNAFIGAVGTPSASWPSGFSIFASQVEGQKDGLFYFSTNGRQANSWGSGTSYQCVTPPVVRTPIVAGTGTAGTCNGFPIVSLNGLWCPFCPKPSKNPGAGAIVQAQFWYRDPTNTSNQTTSLSNAIEFQVCP
jgi:hypothetical protein